MRYVDGFLFAIPKGKFPAYKAAAKKSAKIWVDCGALAYVESVGEDLQDQGALPFTGIMRSKPGEHVCFSWVVYKSRKHRDVVNKEVMGDPRMQKMMKGAFAFDPKRMVYGGFQTIVDVSR